MAIDWQRFANKFVRFENRQVKLTSVRNSGNVTKKWIPASRGDVTTKVMQAMSAAYVRPEVMFCVRLEQAPGPWKPGDLIEDRFQVDATEEDGVGVTYTIQYANADDAFWVLVGFNPKIAFNLKHTVDIYLNEVNRDAAGSTIVDGQVPILTDIPALVQLTNSTPQNYEGKFGMSREYDIYLYTHPNTIDLGHNHIVAWTNPETGKATVFDVKRFTGSQQIDRLAQIHAEVRP